MDAGPPAATVLGVSEPALRIVDEEQNEVALDPAETPRSSGRPRVGGRDRLGLPRLP